MSEKPENFLITARSDKKIVERHFELKNGDFISYRITLPEIKDNPDPSITVLHQASADMVIRFLLGLLPEGYGSKNPHRPGPLK